MARFKITMSLTGQPFINIVEVEAASEDQAWEIVGDSDLFCTLVHSDSVEIEKLPDADSDPSDPARVYMVPASEGSQCA